MYAIRSYYGVLCLVFKFEDEMEGVFKNLITENDWMEIMLLDEHRITSYNVCYTKLLRLGDEGADVVFFSAPEFDAGGVIVGKIVHKNPY